MNTFGDNLENLRKPNKISQKRFDELISTTQQRVSEWKCDKIEPSLYNLMKILFVLNVTFKALTEGVE